MGRQQRRTSFSREAPLFLALTQEVSHLVSDQGNRGTPQFTMQDFKELSSQTLRLELHSPGLSTDIQLSVSPHLFILYLIHLGSEQDSELSMLQMVTKINK